MGKSTREIASLLNVSHVTINKRLSEWNIKRRRSSLNKQHTGRKGKLSRYRVYQNMRFGHLTVISKHPLLYPARWVCRCDCGKTIIIKEKSIGAWKSCGCRGKWRWHKRPDLTKFVNQFELNYKEVKEAIINFLKFKDRNISLTNKAKIYVKTDVGEKKILGVRVIK